MASSLICLGKARPVEVTSALPGSTVSHGAETVLAPLQTRHQPFSRPPPPRKPDWREALVAD